MLAQIVTYERLTTVLVDSLQNLVGGSVPKTGKQSEEAATKRLGGVVLKDDGVQLRGGGDPTLVGHQSLGDGVDGVEDDDLRNASGT